MKRNALAVAAFALLAAADLSAAEPQPVKLRPVAPLVPLYESRDNTYLDYFYTIDPVKHAAAQSMGYVASAQAAGYLERTLQPNTKPFRRFYKGFPEYDNFYTHDEEEVTTVVGLGYVERDPEGYIYTTQVPGSIPLHRLNKWNPSTGDQIHQ